MKKITKFIPLLVLLLLIPLLVVGTTIPNPLGHDTFEDLIKAIVTFIRNLALAIAPIIFLIAGFMYYFSGGDPKKAQTATEIIKWAVIGLVIILVANGLTLVITDIMGVDTPDL